MFYKREEGFLQCSLCGIQPILKLKLQMHSHVNRGELNNTYHEVITISQMSSQLDSYPDDSWVTICGHQPLFHIDATETLCKVGTTSPQQWPDGLCSQPPLNILLADRGHLLCQICTPGVQSGSLLIITLCLIPFCWQVLSGFCFFAPTTMSHQAWPQGEKVLLVSLLLGTPDFNILLGPFSALSSLIAQNSLFELFGVFCSGCKSGRHISILEIVETASCVIRAGKQKGLGLSDQEMGHPRSTAALFSQGPFCPEFTLFLSPPKLPECKTAPN